VLQLENALLRIERRLPPEGFKKMKSLPHAQKPLKFAAPLPDDLNMR